MPKFLTPMSSASVLMQRSPMVCMLSSASAFLALTESCSSLTDFLSCSMSAPSPASCSYISFFALLSACCAFCPRRSPLCASIALISSRLASPRFL